MWHNHPHPFINNFRPLVMAHRGDSSNLPENTLQAFEEASKFDVDCLETDIHMTKDGEFVLFHDETLDRTTNGTGKIALFTLAELKELDAGFYFAGNGNDVAIFRGKGFKIHTIEEIIPKFPRPTPVKGFALMIFSALCQ